MIESVIFIHDDEKWRISHEKNSILLQKSEKNEDGTFSDAFTNCKNTTSIEKALEIVSRMSESSIERVIHSYDNAERSKIW